MKRTVPHLLFGFALVSWLAGCQQPQEKALYPIELKWVRQSVEYQAICEDIYSSAWKAVKEEAANLREDWAVVLDVDETVLDNSGYQEIIYNEGKSFPYFWDDWVKLEKCPPVPGAKAFIDSVRSLGERAHVVYITNRNAPLEEATRNNLIAAGLWQEGDVLLCQQDKNDSKATRRAEVVEGSNRCGGMGKRKIVALLGDQLADVSEYPQGIEPGQYKDHFRGNPEFGRSKFILPNPMYGYWSRGYSR